MASGLASKCEIQIAYAIGVANPVSVMVDTFGTGRFSNADIAAAILTVFDLRPAAIIRYLDLQRPIYQKLAVYGHMGREDLNVLWEKADKEEGAYLSLREPSYFLTCTNNGTNPILKSVYSVD